MPTPGPAAGSSHALLQFLLPSANTTFPGDLLLGILDPADELIASHGREIRPGGECHGIADQALAQVSWKLVHHPTGQTWSAHSVTVVTPGVTDLHCNITATVRSGSVASHCRRLETPSARDRLCIGGYLTRANPILIDPRLDKLVVAYGSERADNGGTPVTSENVAILFTDIVGSTELSQRLSQELADEVRRNHFSVLRQAIAEAGGTEVKNLGDGLMVVFSSASAALACGVAMQQGVEQGNRRSGHRVGLRSSHRLPG